MVNFEALAIKKIIKKIIDVSGLDLSENLKDYLDKNTENHRAPSEFTLFNNQNSISKVVGSIRNGNLTVTEDLIFPGGTTNYPNTYTTVINISLADGRFNPGYYESLYYPLLKEGAMYGLQQVNSENFLGNFQLTAKHTNCGAEVYYRNYSIECFKEIKKELGVAFLSSGFSGVCSGTISDFRELNISIPLISEICATPGLNDKTKYPEFFRVTKDIRFNSNVIVGILKIFNWQDVNVLYDNSTNGKTCYDLFFEQAQKNNINILNNPADRIIKSNYFRTDLEQYSAQFNRIKNSKSKIIVIFVDPPSLLYVIQAFYDLGMRRNDAILVFNLRVSFTIALESDPVQKKKFEELMFGSLGVYQSEWVGEYGKSVQKAVAEYIKSNYTAYRCPSFDSLMLLSNAIKFGISLGFDLQNPAVMRRAVRYQKFTGCSGTVSVSADSNDRSTNILGIYNLVYDASTQNWVDTEIGEYNLGSLQPLKFNSEIIWPDSTTEIPIALKDLSIKCIYDTHETKTAVKST